MEPGYSLPDGVDVDEVVAALREAGSRFAFVFGSRSEGDGPSKPPTEGSDLDVGAWWGEDPPDAWRVGVPAGVDLVVLDSAPPVLAGRIAMWGVLLFDDDPPARVRWQADTRKRFVDEAPRRARVDADFAAAVRRG